MVLLCGSDLEHGLMAVKRVLERIMSAVNVWEGGGGDGNVAAKMEEHTKSSLDEMQVRGENQVFFMEGGEVIWGK